MMPVKVAAYCLLSTIVHLLPRTLHASILMILWFAVFVNSNPVDLIVVWMRGYRTRVLQTSFRQFIAISVM